MVGAIGDAVISATARSSTLQMTLNANQKTHVPRLSEDKPAPDTLYEPFERLDQNCTRD